MKIFLSVILAALMIGCASEFSDNADYLTEAPESYNDLMLQGWTAFESENYNAAITAFSAAAERNATLPGVYLGLGWANIRALNLEEGRIYLGSASAFAFLDAANSAAIELDVKAGLAGIALAEHNYEDAVSYVDAVLAEDASYAFTYDSEVDASALKRIRMLSSFYLGEYTAAFKEAMDNGLTLPNVMQETPASASITGITVVDSGSTVEGKLLTTPWVKVSALGHSIEVNDYVVLAGISDGGDPTLTDLVEKLSQGAGYQVQYILDADNFLLTAINTTEAGLVPSISASSAMAYEGSGIAVETSGADLNGLINVDIYAGRQLIAVNSVAQPGGSAANYEITEIDAGNTQFQVFGNPVFTAGHRVSVDYYYTDNFGEFLSSLVEMVNNI